MNDDTVAPLNDKIAALRSTIAWMDIVLAHVNESIVVLDDNWRVIFANSFLAEILDADRILLLGKFIWEVLPMIDEPAVQKATKLSVASVAQLNGVYEITAKHITRRLLLQSKYIPALNQAICILSDVSIELGAEDALMSLNKEVDNLKQQLKSLKTTKS